MNDDNRSDSSPSPQQQSLGDVQIHGDDNIFNAIQATVVTLTQNRIIQISVDEIKTRPFIIASPYKGLRSFEPEDKDQFFGRDQFIAGLINELEQTNLILLLGASGSGKSSVVRAGLVPWLSQQWGPRLINLTLTPDHDPFESLYGSLLARFKQSEAQLARAGRVNTLRQLVKRLKQPESFWFIFIDQFEELFTVSDPDRRDRFITSLAKLCKEYAADPTLKIVATMRADFLDRLDAEPANRLARLTEKHRPLMTQMHPDELRLAIEQPAAHHGVVFEQGLVETIIQDVQGQAGYLPLLQYTLNQLWESEVRDGGIHDRTLNIQSYRLLGGVRGALQKRVSQIYDALSEAEKLAAQRIFLKLVGIGGNSTTDSDWKPVRKREMRSRFTDLLEQAVLTQLINANLIVSDVPMVEAEATVEIAHEILLTSWNRLKQWITENREAIALRNRLNEDATQWKVTKLDDELWSGIKLAKAVDLQDDFTFKQVLGGFSPDVTEFVNASVGLRDKLAQEEKERQQQQLAQERKVMRRTLVFSVGTLAMAGLVLFSGLLVRQGEIGQIKTSMELSNAKLGGNQNDLEADIESIRAAKIMKNSVWKILLPAELKRSIKDHLLQASLNGYEQNRLEGHSGSINDMVLSPNGKLLATAGDDGTVQLWNTAGQRLHILENHDGSVNCVVFDKSGTLLVSAGEDGKIRLWNIEGELLDELKGRTGEINTLKFKPDGLLATIGEDETIIQFWSIEDNQLSKAGEVTDYNGNDRLLKYSPDGRQQVARKADGTVQLWTGQRGIDLGNAHKGKIYDVAFDPVEPQLATAGADGVVQLWTTSGKPIKTLSDRGGHIHSVAFSPDGTRMATGGDNGIIGLWDIKKQEKIEDLRGHEGRVYELVFSADSQHLATGGYDGTVRLWHREGKELAVFRGHNGRINQVLFDINGQQLITRGDDRTIRLWDREGQQQPVLNVHDDRVYDVVFSPNGEQIATRDKDGTVRLWNGEQQRPLQGQKGKIRDITFTFDGQQLAAAGEDGIIGLWDRDGQLITWLKGHEDYVYDLEFSPVNHQQLISGGQDGIVRLWDLETRQPIAQMRRHEGYVYAVAFSPDGQQIATGGKDGTVRLWDIDTQKQIAIAEPQGYDKNIRDIVFSPDGQQLTMRDNVGTVWLWNKTTQEPVMLEAHKEGILDAAFSPNNPWLATAGKDGTVRLWNREAQQIKVLEKHDGAVGDVTFSHDGKLASSSEDGIIRLWDENGELLSELKGSNGAVYDAVFSPTGERLASNEEDGAVRLWPIEKFDVLLARQCYWVQDYLENSSSVDRSDRHLCNGTNK